MKSFWKVVILAALVALVFYASQHLLPGGETHKMVGQKAPLEVLDPGAQSPGAKGVYFTASWCPSCEKNKPLLKDIPLPLHLVLLRDPTALEPELQKVAASVSLDPQNEKSATWGTRGIPVLFVVDGQGIIRWVKEGVLTRQDIEETIPQVLSTLEPKG